MKLKCNQSVFYPSFEFDNLFSFKLKVSIFRDESPQMTVGQ